MIVIVEMHPKGETWVMTTTPPDIPVTIPEQVSATAIVALLLLQLQPGQPFNVVVAPAQITVFPVIMQGDEAETTALSLIVSVHPVIALVAITV